MNEHTQYFIENKKIYLQMEEFLKNKIITHRIYWLNSVFEKTMPLKEYIDAIKYGTNADYIYILGWGYYFDTYFQKDNMITFLDEGVLPMLYKTPDTLDFEHYINTTSARWIVKVDTSNGEVEAIKGCDTIW